MWNPNGSTILHYVFISIFRFVFLLAYEVVNGSIELIYRADDLYGLGYLLRRSFYDQHMKNSFKDCCAKRFESWIFY